MAHGQIAIVHIVQFVPEYIASIPMIKFCSLESIQIEFVEACVHKFVPEYISHMGTIHKLIRLMECPNECSIHKYELNQLDIFDDESIDMIYDNNGAYRSDNDSNISLLNFRQIVVYRKFNLLSWLDAIYAGIQLIQIQFELKVAQTNQDHALQAFANITHDKLDQNDNDSDTSRPEWSDCDMDQNDNESDASQYECKFNDNSLDFTTYQTDMDYFII